MPRDLIPIYDGVIKANRVGSFVRDGETFDIIRPGFDSQGRSHKTWTQFVHEGVPVYTIKLQANMTEALEQFDAVWEKSISPKPSLLKKALANAKADHKAKFKDGTTGIEPAPAVSVDGRPEGRKYPA